MARRNRTDLPPLGDLELAVLEHLWSEGESDVTAAHSAVGARRGISLNTVGSSMERLHRKGLVARWKVSHAFRYRAAVNRDSLRAQQVAAVVGGTHALAAEGLLAAFVDMVAETDDAALDRLERLIAERRAGKKQ